MLLSYNVMRYVKEVVGSVSYVLIKETEKRRALAMYSLLNILWQPSQGWMLRFHDDGRRDIVTIPSWS
jgi:hypothetical protein